VVNQFTATDITEMNVLGFATSGTPMASIVSQSTATASNGLNAPALSFMGSSPPVAFMTDDVPILDVSLHPLGGIEEIAWFKYGENELRIDLQGAAASAVVAFDTTVNGKHSIALANRTDTTHGLILTDMPANNTAADLIAHHLSFSGGQAFLA
jgi:hypothetical protein